MRTTMIGSAYVGLVSGACFSDFGHDVICVDKDQTDITVLEAGKMPIFELELDTLVASNVAAGRLRFTTDLKRRSLERTLCSSRSARPHFKISLNMERDAIISSITGHASH